MTADIVVHITVKDLLNKLEELMDSEPEWDEFIVGYQAGLADIRAWIIDKTTADGCIQVTK